MGCNAPGRLLEALRSPRRGKQDRAEVDAVVHGITIDRGRYHLDRVAGRGGMATVFVARDGLLGAPRAIKMALPGRSTMALRRARMRREADVMSRIRHRHVSTMYDFVRTEVIDYLVLEYVDGLTVSDAMKSELSTGRAVRMIAQALTGLSAVHLAGVIHRDVKPTNVMLTRTGETKLLDFGISLMSGDTVRMTSPGFMMGTLAYMAPEQIRDSHEVDHLVDLYATGCLLFAALGGGIPNELWSEPRRSTRWDGIPRRFVPVIRRSVHRDRDKRFCCAADMVDALLDVSEEFVADAEEIRGVLMPTPSDRPTQSDSPVFAVVGAETSVGEVIRSTFPDLGPTVRSFRHGEDFLTSSADMPDLILLDLSLPDWSGFDTLADIRSRSNMACVPVIVLTCLDSGPEIERALSMGADDYVTRPFGPQALRARVLRWLNPPGPGV